MLEAFDDAREKEALIAQLSKVTRLPMAALNGRSKSDDQLLLQQFFEHVKR